LTSKKPQIRRRYSKKRNKKIKIHMKPIIKKYIQIVLLSLIVFGGTHYVYAQTPAPTEYTVLSPLPGTTKGGANCTGPSCTADLGSFLPGLFNLMIGVGAVAAFIVITIYGLEYMLTDSLATKGSARGMVENALWGLGLIIFAYLILYTLQPVEGNRFLNGNLNITAPKITAPASVSGGSNPNNSVVMADPCDGSDPTACQVEQETVAALKAAHVNINATCTSTSCVTQVGGLSQAAIAGISNVGNSCNCNLVITGGSEPTGHTTNSTHTAGTAVDVVSNGGANSALNQLITSSTNPPAACYTTNTVIGGQTASVLYEPLGSTCGGTVPSGANHWHITFS
jgi:hypothetical protein